MAAMSESQMTFTSVSVPLSAERHVSNTQQRRAITPRKETGSKEAKHPPVHPNYRKKPRLSHLALVVLSHTDSLGFILFPHLDILMPYVENKEIF